MIIKKESMNRKSRLNILLNYKVNPIFKKSVPNCSVVIRPTHSGVFAVLHLPPPTGKKAFLLTFHSLIEN